MLKIYINRITAATLAVVITITSLTFTVSAAYEPEQDPKSEGVYMVNTDTDIVLYKKNEKMKLYPASLTKIMTCLITLEKVKDLDQKVEITYDATNEFFGDDPNKQGPSVASFAVGQDNLTYRDCLYGLMIVSGCEAANVLALNVAGDIETFVGMMNEEAARLGCENTHFGNAHGLHQPDNYSCAYDMYLITRYAYDTYPEFMEIANTTEYTFPANVHNPNPYTMQSTNQLIRGYVGNDNYYEFAAGVKTGSIDRIYDMQTKEWAEGSSNLVSTATKQGFTYMLATLGAPYHDATGAKHLFSFEDHIALYRWAFGEFSYKQVLSKNDPLGEIPVTQGKNADHVILFPADDYSTILNRKMDDSSVLKDIELTEASAVAPVEKGQILGSVKLRLSGEELVSIPLVAGESVDRSTAAHIADLAVKMTQTIWFRVLITILGIMVVLTVSANIVSRSRRDRKHVRPVARSRSGVKRRK
ncbi:serine-type D-Ala-D-Ala carboxypeptidase [Clostridia bacterium]|nr:serine-type D-Ala-D-Ala carboxypeptidase [Clostridia bacterium]